MGRIPRSGEIVDDRFLIEQLAGAGGMGQVYRARDRRSGELVALKVMHDAESLEIERFAREAHVLATLSHPGIVRYIDSGTTGDGDPYLVMEWLSGETLSMRLQRTQITLAETLGLGRRVASALGAIHRRGVVHRDIKPSNVFLRNGSIDDVALIDFGMARRPVDDPKLTVTGTMLGTPGYMAPEQVYNLAHIDGRADIFSLGCVLYRCISGRPPYRHDSLHMLLEGAPDQVARLRELRPSVPKALDELVARMLSRSAEDRPSNGDVVATELLAIEESDPSLRTRSGPRSVLSEIMASERRLMCLVVARPPNRRAEQRLPAMDRGELERALRAVAERHRGKLEIFADGSLLVILSNADAAPDLAIRAARCALSIRILLGAGSVVVVSGREVLDPALPETELLERAVDLLDSTAKGAAVRIDELTSALLKNRFETGSKHLHLRGEARDPGRMRLMYGEPGPCVGREQELAQLETIFDQCVEERVASMVLLTGPTGAGKSRLGHELLRRLEVRGRPVEVWLGQGDPLNVGASYGLLAQLLRRGLGLVEGEPIEVRREKILAWIARRAHGGGIRFAELLGDLVGTPFEGEDGADAAGRGAQLSSEQMGQAFLSFLRTECAAQPVVLVLEDLHWGDLASIRLIDTALGALGNQPLLVLGLARTRMDELFPQQRSGRAVQELRLRKLSRRACEQLVRHELGVVGDETIRILSERSEGHAAYLEQMVRGLSEGYGPATPQTVLAMVQARLEKLDPAARRVLRAASIFGETFWRGGVEALLGGGDTAAWLAELVEQDVITVKPLSHFPIEVEFHFRHPLVHEAAYGMLTEGDRVAGHWLAAQWLEQAGETDPKVLAQHFDACGGGGVAELVRR